ncbi:MAG: hypothetical protein KC657_15730 [Myxococcales bacterium]|nr:hypothetical protein [Myxococcales bacterium]
MAGALVFACIIAEPPGALPRLPASRPTIVRSAAVPPPSTVLGTFPEKFVVPVELADPTASFRWRAFVDYNPLTGAGFVAGGESKFDRASLDGGARVLEIPVPPPPDLDRCHVVEILVALRFAGEFEGKQAHTPEEPGGDNVSWFYSPTGDLEGCPKIDAGGLSPEAGAGEGGPP